ncbi:glutathione S-transferase F12-like [Gossypium hirsutum]|uniref:glutathione transferase n=1 Tax=Gossypium hirsutum TaxID=3635 RepID=A0A0D5MCP3_GOSHI|nr:glutathione S-transferase F12-like [Gossypium hirsutum]AJY54643.1 glutathione S-transferase [Gossypium hirsutum]
MVVKVYGPIKAACPQRVLACLLEKEVEFQIVDVDLEAGDHKKPDFLLRQPFGQVPAIEDGDFKLFESRAIIRYYAAKYEKQGTNLLGNSLEERAMVDQWLEVEAHNFNDLAYTLVFQLLILPRMGKQGDTALVLSCQQKLEKVLDIYEQRLSTTAYLAGDSFTLADLSHLPALRYLVDDVGMWHMVSQRKHVNAWRETISNRAAWKKLMKLANL